MAEKFLGTVFCVLLSGLFGTMAWAGLNASDNLKASFRSDYGNYGDVALAAATVGSGLSSVLFFWLAGKVSSLENK